MPSNMKAIRAAVRKGAAGQVRGQKSVDLYEPELVSAVCRLFLDGLAVKDIFPKVESKFNLQGQITREDIYVILRYAGKHKWLRYDPPAHTAYQTDIENNFGWLDKVSVVHTVTCEDVTFRAAQMLLRLVQHHHTRDKRTDEIHIGLAAGRSMQLLAQAFAELLGQPAKDLPSRIVFHAMVSGFDPGDPTTNPIAFFTFFLNRAVLQVEPRFVSLHAPAMVNPRAIPRLKESWEIGAAFQAVQDLDIIVTSGSDWDDDHSSLKRCMQQSSEESVKKLIEAGTVGDMLWRPIGTGGPIGLQTDIRALTLIELSDLPAFIRKGKHVMLVLGPCVTCDKPKGRVLYTTLNQPEPLMTHLVVDSRTAASFSAM